MAQAIPISVNFSSLFPMPTNGHEHLCINFTTFATGLATTIHNTSSIIILPENLRLHHNCVHQSQYCRNDNMPLHHKLKSLFLHSNTVEPVKEHIEGDECSSHAEKSYKKTQ